MERFNRKLKTLPLLLLPLLAAPSYAEQVTIRVLGFWGNQPQVDDVDKGVWQSIEKETDGRIKVEYVTLNEAGVKGNQGLRFLKKGTFDIMTISVSYVSGDEPSLVAVDLPAIAYDFDTLKNISDSYRDTMAERLERFNGVLLSHWPFNPQIMFCKDPINSLDDLKGKKVRVSGAPAADALEKLGGTAVNMTGGEVYQALQRGLVDCASTGTTFGFKNKLHEVTNYLYDLPIGGYSQVIQVANSKFWDRLDGSDRELIRSKLQHSEKELWAMAPAVHEIGISCNTSSSPCALQGEPGVMKYSAVSVSDRDKLAKILHEDVVPKWVSSCNRVYKECGDRFEALILPETE
ncbi:TRAP transporter substrate-binding protein [Photobacterium satsumensis]|uniref:TRAP transporter substrate-binding protein n=1 Tax=Photobacterium satsumensis TaxID=2910239 RepID=UPI003D0D1885